MKRPISLAGLGESAATRTQTLFWATYVVLLLGAVTVGTASGMLFGYAIDLPKVEELEANQPGTVSYVFADDGRVLGQFALERRVLVSYAEIPQRMREAILAAEDENFFRHSGIDFKRALATLFNNLRNWERKGASTLTMQLSKLRFTSSEKTYERKLKDLLYAIDIEKNYSKEQIFTFYCNQINLGHGNYGIAAAADFYFQKRLDELTLAESALIAGLIQIPASRSPIAHPDRAVSRRNWVLGRMVEAGFITDEERAEAQAEILDVREKLGDRSPAPYFVEWVRQYLEEKYATSEIWQRGLRIHTTVDYDMQVAATRALQEGLEAFDRKGYSWRGALENIGSDETALEEYTHPDWRLFFYEGQRVHGLVLESDSESATVRLGSYTARLGAEAIAWTGRKQLDRILKKGDVAFFRLTAIDRQVRTIEATLDQIPEAQGGLLALENRTGAIKAMVGGYDFELSKFNRAMQARRQPGSIFKPFTFVAALEAGFTPYDQVLDSPATFVDGLGRPYEPSNSDNEFLGLIPLRDALAKSRNIPTVRLANAIGPAAVSEVARRFGLVGGFPPYLSLALGSAEVTLGSMVSAFSAFPNGGVRAEPYFVKRVEDNNGVLLEENRPHLHDEVISPQIADQMVLMLQGTVQRGTATLARQLGRPLGGKTGTTNDYTDSWFIGFTPQFTAGIWTGHDQKLTLGEGVYGATLALPIFVDFAAEAFEPYPADEFTTDNAPDSFFLTSDTTSRPAPATDTKSVRVEDIKPPPGR